MGENIELHRNKIRCNCKKNNESRNMRIFKDISYMLGIILFGALAWICFNLWYM